MTIRIRYTLMIQIVQFIKAVQLDFNLMLVHVFDCRFCVGVAKNICLTYVKRVFCVIFECPPYIKYEN